MPTEKSGVGNRRPLSMARQAVRFLDWVTRVAFYMSAATLAVIAVLYCMEIVLRYFFLSPTVWTRDTVTYLLCGTIFLAAPEVAKNNSHVAITIAVEMCKEKHRTRIETLLVLIAALVAGGVCWVTAIECIRLFNAGILTLGTVAVPKWWISAVIPLGFLLISLQYFSQVMDQQRRGHDRTQI